VWCVRPSIETLDPSVLLCFKRRSSAHLPSTFKKSIFRARFSVTASSVLLPRRKSEQEKEYKSNSVLKRLGSEQKIMFVYWKLGQICVCDDVTGVAKLSAEKPAVATSITTD
jgi:hypothetical protein